MSSERRVALVTAGADGIGGATVEAFRAKGYLAVAADIDGEALERRWGSAPAGEVTTRTLDVTDVAAVEQVVAEVVATHGRIDALANVVGGSRPGQTVVELEPEAWDRLLTTNLTSVFLMCKAVIPQMEARGGGTIVNVSSGAGVRGMTANPGYVAAKAGVVALTRALALDHGPNGVRSNCVAPGPVATPLMRRNRTEDEIAMLGRMTLAGRIGEPSEIADVIVWLAGDESSYVMGQTVEVDGGVGSVV
jgi:NAD(P)-dependent dehydrogenase (short-subunit alcohol dehydrogenase family)